MAKMIFKSALGFADANVHRISGAGIPGGDNGPQDAAPLGSIYTDSVSAMVYYKVGSANNVTDWVKSITEVEQGNLQTQINTNSANIATEVSDRTAAVSSEASARQAADAAIQAELDASQAGAGLAVDGSYVAPTTSNYLAATTSLANADLALDTQLAATEAKATANAADIVNINSALSTNSTNATNADAAIQAELDATQAGAGLAADGSYVAPATSNYLSATTSLAGADAALDTRLGTVEATANAAIPSAEKAAPSGVATLDASGKLVTGQLPAISIGVPSVVASEAEMLALIAQSGDTAVRTDLNKTFVHNGGTTGTVADWTELLTPTDTIMQGEIDATQAGAGLAADGSYVPTATANYISGATSLDNATQILDGQVAANAASISTNATDIAAVSNNLSTEVSNRQSADAALQSEVDAIEAGAGLSVTGAYVPDAAANYIAGATSVHGATQILDGQVAANAATIASNESTNAAAHASMNALMGNGAYASTVNIAAGDDLTVAVGKLDAALSDTVSTANHAGITAGVVDAISTKADQAVKWVLSVRETATPTNKVVMEILATHDGDSLTDATFSDWSEYAELELGAQIPGLGITVALAGTGAAQNLELSVSATSAVDVKVTRLAV
jgi:hypothetical protein